VSGAAGGVGGSASGSLGGSGGSALSAGGSSAVGGSDVSGAGGTLGGSSSGGSAGIGGRSAPLPCQLDSDCPVPMTEPPACVRTMCLGRTCRYEARDSDGDRATAAHCVSKDPAITILTGSDCDDTKPRVYPFAPELCNGFDDNCDGVVDEMNGSVDVQPVAPGAHLVCSGMTWYATSWSQGYASYPPDPAPSGPCTVQKLTFYDDNFNALSLVAPLTLFRIERQAGVGSDGADYVTVTLDMSVLKSMSPASRDPILQVFKGKGGATAEVPLASMTYQFPIHILNISVPFLLN
jgi:hypothetical protein